MAKAKSNPEVQVLELLKQVLPKAIHDPALAGKIFSAAEKELKFQGRATAFEKFCAKVELPDLEPKTVENVRRQFLESFGGSKLTLKPNPSTETLAVTVVLPDGAQLNGVITVRPVEEQPDEEQEIKVKFVPFPVSLPGDKELVWLLAKAENLTPEEAAIALAKAEEDFWGSKTGQKLIRDRVERCFPEFMERGPAKLLKEVGLKRHYKTPEPVKVLNPVPLAAPKAKAKDKE